MNFLLLLFVGFVCVAADVSHLKSTTTQDAAIVKNTFDIKPEGGFQYAYETSNGIHGLAEGSIKDPQNEYPSLEVVGGFKYTSPDGSPVEIKYIANENGYQPTGNVIPTPHPIPELIARSLEYARAHPPVQATNAGRFKRFENVNHDTLAALLLFG